MRPTRENLRTGKLLGHSGWRFCGILWRGAEAFAEREPAAFAETLADLSELRAFAMPGRQIELFLVGAAAEPAAAAHAESA